MTQAQPKQAQTSQRELLRTSKDRAVNIGNFDLCIPQGAEVNGCLEYAQMFLYIAEEALQELTAEKSEDDRFPVSALRCVRYTLALAAAMNETAHAELLPAGLLHARGAA